MYVRFKREPLMVRANVDMLNKKSFNQFVKGNLIKLKRIVNNTMSLGSFIDYVIR